LGLAAKRTVWQRFLGAVSPKPVSIRYAGGLFLDVTRLAVAFVAGVEAVFLTDLVITHVLPHVLDNRASLVNVVLLVGLTLPSGLYIALPVAILAAAYFALLHRREAREFIVLAGMGRGAGPIVRFAVLTGAAGMALSFFLSGYVEPLSRYAAGRTMFDVGFEAIKTGSIGAGKFYSLNGFTIFAGSGQTNQVASKVFFLQELGDERYRLITATQSQRINEPEMTDTGVVLDNAAAYDFEVRKDSPPGTKALGACENCEVLQVVPGGARTSNQIFIDLPSLEFPDHEPRGDKVEDRTSLELLGGDLRDDAVKRELGGRLLRGLLVLLAPLLALLAVSLTRPATFLLALPTAAGLILAGSFFGPRLIDELVSFGLGGAVTMLLAGTSLLVGLIVGLTFRFESGCIQHGGVQA
jgi:lipopolysaccharide export LptBFGC system permease protein LptF